MTEEDKQKLIEYFREVNKATTYDCRLFLAFLLLFFLFLNLPCCCQSTYREIELIKHHEIDSFFYMCVCDERGRGGGGGFTED